MEEFPWLGDKLWWRSVKDFFHPLRPPQGAHLGASRQQFILEASSQYRSQDRQARWLGWYLQIPGPHCNNLLHDAFGSFTGRMFRPRVQQEAILRARWASGGQKQLCFVLWGRLEASPENRQGIKSAREVTTSIGLAV